MAAWARRRQPREVPPHLRGQIVTAIDLRVRLGLGVRDDAVHLGIVQHIPNHSDAIAAQPAHHGGDAAAHRRNARRAESAALRAGDLGLKLADAIQDGPAVSSSAAQDDIAQALVALGYSDKEASQAIKALPAEVGVSEGIKLALKALNS